MLCWRTWTSNVSWYIFEFVFVSYVYICIIKHDTFQGFSITFALSVNSFPPAEEFERGNETKGDEATPGENDDSGRNGLHEEHSRGSSDNETADDEDDGHRKFGHKEHSKKAPEGDEGAKAQDPFSNETNLGHRPFNGSELDHHGGYAPKLE